MFNKMLSSIGIGSAKVDAQLDNTQCIAGETVKGIVKIVGGKTEQQIDQIYLSVNTKYIKERDDKKYSVDVIIDKFKITDSLVVKPEEQIEFPFSFVLPEDTPLTAGRTKVWLSTGLDIKNAIDPGDKDFIEVKPSPEVAAVLEAVHTLGFSLREVETKEAPRRFRGRLPFIQEFEYVPRSGPYKGVLDEIELLFTPKGNGQIEVIMQIDKRARGLSGLFAEALDQDESYVRFEVSKTNAPGIQETIRNIIDQYS